MRPVLVLASRGMASCGLMLALGAAPSSPAPGTSPGPAAVSTPAIVYGYTFTPAASTDTPRIISVQLNSNTLHAGGPIDLRVTTTPDVSKVTSGNGKHKGTLSAAGGGVFFADSTLPKVGGLATVSIKIHIEATTADGKTAAVDVPVRYR